MNRYAPEEFQDRIDAKMGTNPYGEPLFKLVWGQTELMRAGGQWAGGFRGYRDIKACHNSPCWCIMMWEPASTWGDPYTFYSKHRDEFTGLQDLGGYPYHGKYRLIHSLMHREMVNGKLVTEAMELSNMIIDSILPMTRAWQSLSKEKQVAALKFEQDLRDQEAAAKLVEGKTSYAPAWKGNPVSYTGQGCRTSLIAKKEELIYRNWDRLMEIAKYQRRGLSQYS